MNFEPIVKSIDLPGHDKEQMSSLASLEAQWPAEQASQNAWCLEPFIRECISMATLVCAHGTVNLTNRGLSELVEECIFHALEVRTRTTYKKNDRLKNIFCCI